mgnify:CR=1 FL=1
MIIPSIRFNKRDFGQLGVYNNDSNTKNCHAYALPQMDSVSFGYKLRFKNFNIPCSSCGGQMMSAKSYKKFTERIVGKSTKEILNIIASYGKYLRPTEKACLEILKKENKLNPDADLKELLIGLSPEFLKSLTIEQFKVLDKIDKLGTKLPFEEQKALKHLNNNARNIISGRRHGAGNFKRKIWLDNIFNFVQTLPNQQLSREIYKTADSFPTSENSVNAFIVKYSRREPTEIARRFLIDTIVSVDHILAKHLGGESHWNNYVLKCRGCNSHEGHDTPLERVQKNPHIHEHSQKSMDRIIEFINAGSRKMRGFYEYPRIIAEKYHELTQCPKTGESLIKLDISGLKPQGWIDEQRRLNLK